MARKEQEPIETDGSMGGKRFVHPAYGMIGCGRVSGRAVLFGSDFVHQHFVRITVRRAELHRDLSRDWTHGREQLVELFLSEAQWATFVSSMNMGDGVPCTLAWTAGDGVLPGIPYRNEQDSYHSEMAAAASAVTDRLDAALAVVESELAGLSKAKRERVLGEIRGARGAVASHMPFVAKQFGEHMEQTVERARVEVNAYMQGAVMRAGVAAPGVGEIPPLMLGQPDDNEA